MKGNESQKGQKLENAAGLGGGKSCLNFIRKRAVFGNLWGGGPRGSPDNQKMKGNQGPNGQNERKSRPKKVKMKGNQSPKKQNERKSKPKKPK